MIYHLPLRQAEGFVGSVLVQMGLDLRVPDYSTLSRRHAALAVELPPPQRGPIHLVVDSTGLKVYGEGEVDGAAARSEQAAHLAQAPPGRG